ncbi:MAG: hypothetical protein E7371_01410 [Clostridiales bacterium]|nr:hypothetical protein [Clostridiales bacterium]
MISLHSILAAGGALQSLPKLFGIASGILLAIAFAIGFLKGFRKVNWNGLTWATAAGLFLLISRSINPEGSVTKRFVYAMLIALVCIAGVLALYGVLAYYLRPRVRWIKDDVNGDTSLAEYGLEFEPEYLDYDGEHDWWPYGKRIYKTGFGTPSFAFRMLGGITCVINVGIILWVIASAGLVFINSFGVLNNKFGALLNGEIVQKFLHLAQVALLETVSIGVVILVAKKGYVNGWLNTIRMMIFSIGSTGVIIVCMYLPFSSLATSVGILTRFVNRCISLLDGRVPFLVNVMGKLLAGAILSGLGVVAMFGLNMVLKHCCRLVSNSAPTRMVDAILSCGLYMLIGAGICVGIWFVLAALDYVELFNISNAMSYEGAHLSNGMYNFAYKLVEKLVSKI